MKKGRENTATEVYVARQPIFDKNMKLYGYELLYRKTANNFYEGTDAGEATATVIHNSFLVIGFHDLIDDTKGFINFPEELLDDEQIPYLLPKDKVIIEILETVDPNESILKACKNLKEKGYTLALDDFVFAREDYGPLIDLADIIKIEFSATDQAEQRKFLNRYKNKKIFLAERIETREEYQQAIQMGYDLFQGYFFSKPLMVKSKDLGHLDINLIQVLKELHQEEPDFSQIAMIIEKDLGLSYKLLKLANSILFGGNFPIKSLGQAVVRLGVDEMIRWISVMLIKGIQSIENAELVKTSLIRGKILSLLSKEIKIGGDFSESDCFMTGILSSIDVILNDDMDKILGSLPLSDGIKKTLLGKDTELREYLDAVIAYERFELDSEEAGFLAQRISLSRYMDLYAEAITWLQSTND